MGPFNLAVCPVDEPSATKWGGPHYGPSNALFSCRRTGEDMTLTRGPNVTPPAISTAKYNHLTAEQDIHSKIKNQRSIAHKVIGVEPRSGGRQTNSSTFTWLLSTCRYD